MSTAVTIARSDWRSIWIEYISAREHQAFVRCFAAGTSWMNFEMYKNLPFSVPDTVSRA